MTEQDIIRRVPDIRKKDYCQFYVGKERWCSATCTDSCKGCRFFAPTYKGKMKIMLDFIDNQNLESLRQARRLAEAKAVIQWLRNQMKK